MPSAVESNTTLLPAASYSSVVPVEGDLEVDEDLEQVVVDDDGLGGVGGLGPGLGDDGDDRLADVADPVAGQQRAGDAGVERGRRPARRPRSAAS